MTKITSLEIDAKEKESRMEMMAQQLAPQPTDIRDPEIGADRDLIITGPS
jgi:hypothetical protein